MERRYETDLTDGGHVNEVDKIGRELSLHGWTVAPFNGDQSRFLSFANSFGDPIPSRRDGTLVDILVPSLQQDAPPRSMSAIFGEGAFPYHTDAAYLRIPPKYVLLRVVRGQECTRDTLLIDTKNINLSASEERRIRNEVWLVNGGRGRFYSPIINIDMIEAVSIVRYDLNCMRPVTRHADESGRAFWGALQNAPRMAFSWRDGIILLIDNWRMLHARGPKPSFLENDRVLERILISVKNKSAKRW